MDFAAENQYNQNVSEQAKPVPTPHKGGDCAYWESEESLKGIMRAVDRFCGRHPRFGIRNLMMYIIIGNIVVYLFSVMDTTHTLSSLLAFSARDIMHGQVWRLVTFVMVPNFGGLLSLVLSLYFYYFIGTSLERQWGQAKFTVYYLSGMAFMIVFGMLVYWIFQINLVFTSYYFNLSMFFVFATFFPDMQVLLFFFIPIKMKWLALIDLAYFVIAIVTSGFPQNLFPVVILLHYMVFCGGWLIDYIRPARFRQRARTVNFKREAARVRREQAQKPYNRKCDVCGRTDVSNPELEFRYCSRCDGYHCFCQDHINNHVHFKEK